MEEKQGLFSKIGEWRPLAAIAEHIRTKLLVSNISVALIPLILLGIVSYLVASNALATSASGSLEAVRTNKGIAVQAYFDEYESDMTVLAETTGTFQQEAFNTLNALQKNRTSRIASFINGRIGDALFVSELSITKGADDENTGVPVFSQYKNNKSDPAYIEATKRADEVLESFAANTAGGAYVDVMIADLSGEIVYALDSESLGTEEGDSPEFINGLEAPYLGDYTYHDETGEIYIRVSAPIKDNRDRTIGVVFMEMLPITFNKVMQDRTGLGEAGEIYLVGQGETGGELRSDRVVKEGNIFDPKSGDDVNGALSGRSGQSFKIGSTGDYEISVYSPLNIPNQNWGIIATTSVKEIMVPTLIGEEYDYLTNYNTEYGNYDTFLFSPDGYMFYSVAKEADYHTNMLTGPYKDTNLGQLVGRVLEAKEYGVADFALYAPSGGAPAAFVAQPVLGQDGEVQVIIASQLPVDQINALMQEVSGMGETGETYLIGQDNLWRSNSRFAAELGTESTILNPDYIVNTTATQNALAGNSGSQIINDYRGVSVSSSWQPITVQAPGTINPNGITWAMMAEIDEAEVQAPVLQVALITVGLVLASAIVVVIVSVVVSGGLTKQIDTISGMFSMVGMGDFDARAEVVSRDELGDMAISLNAMLDNTLSLIQSDEEREMMQNSIMKLLEEIAGVADRDLTVEAEVTADMTGAIADSFNMMIVQLREVISDVQDTTLQVSASANEVQATTEHLAIGSEEQAAQIVDTSAALDEMAVSIQQVSENAALSATVSEQSTANARQGSQSVQNTIQGMGRIREQVQETSKRIKRLGESSQEVGEIVQLIGDIADRTSILALNASIQAAMAGDAGRGFAVVAEEVERLAERSTEATKQIDNLIRTIQNETYEAVAAMETMTNEVVTGSDLAQEAGTALDEIETVSVRLSDLIQQISLASKQQARGSETIARSMNDIAEVTQQTAAGTKQAAVSISNLSILADDLRSSVSTFKVPGSSNGSNSDDDDYATS